MSPLGWGRPAGQQRLLNIQQARSIFLLTEAEFWKTNDELSSVEETDACDEKKPEEKQEKMRIKWESVKLAASNKS